MCEENDMLLICDKLNRLLFQLEITAASAYRNERLQRIGAQTVYEHDEFFYELGITTGDRPPPYI